MRKEMKTHLIAKSRSAPCSARAPPDALSRPAPFMAYAPYQSSRLASSPSAAFDPGPASVASSSDVPSSPSTASFYGLHHSTQAPSSTCRNTSRPRLYKSQSSHRTSSARNTFARDSPSSSPSHAHVANPFRSIHENARLQRSRRASAQRDLTAASVLVPDEPGGWTRDGHWEEFDEYEKERLELEMLKERKEYKWQMKIKDEQASDALVDPDDEFAKDDEHDMHEGAHPLVQ